MLDHIIVETGGVKIPLNGVALVSAIDAKTLSVTPYDSHVIFLYLVFYLVFWLNFFISFPVVYLYINL